MIQNRLIFGLYYPWKYGLFSTTVRRVTDLVSRRSIHAPYPKTLARHPTRPRFVQRRRRTDGRAGGGAGGGDDGLGLPGLSERKDAPTAGEVLLRRRISGLGATPAMRE